MSTQILIPDRTIPAYDLSNVGQVLKIGIGIDGKAKLIWAADETGGVAPQSGSFDASASSAGGRGQIAVPSRDGSYVNCGSDQGGSARCSDFTGFHTWFQTNAQSTDVNNHRSVHSMFQDFTDLNKWWKLTDNLFYSTDGGNNYTLDAGTGAPTHSQAQMGLAASFDPRAVGNLLHVNAANQVICGTDTGVKRKDATTGNWDTMNFPRSDAQAICVWGNPLNKNEVWVVVHKGTGTGDYASYLYRSTNTNVTTPTWAGPYTGGSAFTSIGATFYPQEVRTSGDAVVVMCVNPAAVNADSSKEAVEHGVYILNSRTNTTTAAFTRIGGTTIANRTSLSTRALNCMDLQTDGTQSMIVCGYTNVNNTYYAVRFLVTGTFLSTNVGTVTNLSTTMDNDINGSGSTWCLLPAGSQTAPLGGTGICGVGIDPTNLDRVWFGGRQGQYRCSNFKTTGTLVPVPHGLGGPTAFPGAAFDSDENQLLGTSDNHMVPVAARLIGPTDPSDALPVSIPPDMTNQTHGSIICVDSDDNVYSMTRDYAIAENYGVEKHPAFDPSWDDADWSNLGFHDGTPVAGGGAGTAQSYFGGTVWKNGSAQVVILAAQGANGWWRKVGAGSIAHPTTPPSTPSTYADLAIVGNGSGVVAGYIDVAGISYSSDYGDHWTTKLSGTIGSIPSDLRNFAGFVEFHPTNPDILFAASDVAIWMIVGISSGSPVAYNITGSVTRPGPMTVTATEILIYSRQTATQVCQVFHAPFPTGTPPTAPNWTAYPDPNGRLAGSAVFACKMIAAPGSGNFIVSSQGGGQVIYYTQTA